MDESEHKTKLVKEFKAAGHYARRIEDQFGVGFPDIVIKMKGHAPAFVEVKLFDRNVFAPTPRQFVDLVALHEPPHSFGLVLGIKDGMFYLSGPRKKVNAISDCFVGPNLITLLPMFISKTIYGYVK